MLVSTSSHPSIVVVLFPVRCDVTFCVCVCAFGVAVSVLFPVNIGLGITIANGGASSRGVA